MDFEKVRGVIAETLTCDLEKVTDEALLVDDLGTDSLAMVELAMAIEEATGVTVEDIKGSCPQNMILLAILGDTASVEEAIQKIDRQLRAGGNVPC